MAFSNLRADLRRNLEDYEPLSPVRRMALCLTLNSVHALVLIRFQFWCARHGLPTLFAAKLLFWFFRIEINKSATLGPGLRLPHPMGILIAPNVSVGSHCDLYADVRLVLSHGNPQGPRIADHAFLGDGAKVLGAVDVGTHAEVGAGAIVTRDVPAQGVVAGVPAKLLRIKPSIS